MTSSDDRQRDFTIIGENIHTTRVVLRRSKRFTAEPGREALHYVSVSGEPRLLAIPEVVKKSQDFDEGRIKHVRVAVLAAMSDDEPARAEGLSYIAKLVADQEQAGAHYLDLNVDEISVKRADQIAAMAWLVATVQGTSTAEESTATGNRLMLVVKPSGARSWVFRCQVNGRRCDIGLGPWPDVTLAAAREKAIETRRLMREGGDPVAARRRATSTRFRDAGAELRNGSVRVRLVSEAEFAPGSVLPPCVQSKALHQHRTLSDKIVP